MENDSAVDKVFDFILNFSKGNPDEDLAKITAFLKELKPEERLTVTELLQSVQSHPTND